MENIKNSNLINTKCYLLLSVCLYRVTSNFPSLHNVVPMETKPPRKQKKTAQ